MKANFNELTITRTNFKGQELSIPVEYFKEKVKSMLMGGYIGDGLGLPVEMKTKEYIDETFGRIDKFLPTSNHDLFRDFVGEEDTGITSDDTAGTVSIVESLLEKDKLDFQDIMDKTVSKYLDKPYGYGGGTKHIFDKYELGKYDEIERGKTAGNGIIMKQSPLAAYSVGKGINEKSIDDNIEELTTITHGHPTSIVASLVHNKFLMELLKAERDINFEELLNYLIDYSKGLEDKFLEEGNDKVSELLEKLLEDTKNGGLNSFDEILEKYGWGDNKIGLSGYVLTTIGIVYSIFLNKQNFEGLLDSINIGGDTDTFAAIIGNMIGAYKGKFYTEYYEQGVDNSEELIELSEKFGDLITN